MFQNVFIDNNLNELFKKEYAILKNLIKHVSKTYISFVLIYVCSLKFLHGFCKKEIKQILRLNTNYIFITKMLHSF